MRKIAMGFSKALLVFAVALLGVIAVPAGNAFALPAVDPTVPPPTVANQRLELVWARLQAEHARLEVIFDFADERIAGMQQPIARARANGKDVSDLQSALDILQNAIELARPVFQSTNGIIGSHQGFDSNGNVTDRNAALETVKDLAEKYRQVRIIVQPALQSLRQAVQDFRQTNTPISTPSS